MFGQSSGLTWRWFCIKGLEPAKGDLQGAGQAFARVSQSYPSSQKVPDANATYGAPK